MSVMYLAGQRQARVPLL